MVSFRTPFVSLCPKRSEPSLLPDASHLVLQQVVGLEVQGLEPGESSIEYINSISPTPLSFLKSRLPRQHLGGGVMEGGEVQEWVS